MPKEPGVSKVPPILLPDVPEGVSGRSGTRGGPLVTGTRAVGLRTNTVVMGSAGMSDGCRTRGERFLPSDSQKTPASPKHQGSPDQKTSIPVEPLGRRHRCIAVVPAKYMRVNDAVDPTFKDSD